VSVYFGGPYPTLFEFSAMSISLYSFGKSIKNQIKDSMRTLKFIRQWVGVNVGRPKRIIRHMQKTLR
jgi:hypothetical protein